MLFRSNLNDLYTAGPEASYTNQSVVTPSPVATPTTPGTVLQERAWNPVSSGGPGTEVGNLVQLDNGKTVWVSQDGSLVYERTGNYWDRTPTTVDAVRGVITPELPPLSEPPGTPIDTNVPVYEPTITEPPVVTTPVSPVTPETPVTDWNNVPNIDIAGSQTPGTNVQVFDDGSILVTDQSGQVIGNVDSTGVVTGPIDLTRFDDGSVLVTNTKTGASLGGIEIGRAHV